MADFLAIGVTLAGVLTFIDALLSVPSRLSGGPLVCIHHVVVLTICKRLRYHVHIGMRDRAVANAVQREDFKMAWVAYMIPYN